MRAPSSMDGSAYIENTVYGLLNQSEQLKRGPLT